MPSFNTNSRRSRRSATTREPSASRPADSESTIAMLAKMFTEGKITQQEFLQAMTVLHIGIGTVTPPKPTIWGGKNRRRGTKKRRGH